MRLSRFLPLLILLAAIAAIAADGARLTSYFFVLKPLTTFFIIAYAWPRGQALPQESRTRPWVLRGLWFSLGGDVALLWPEQGFIFGLLSFLCAHLCYLWAFTRVQRFAAWPWPFLGYGLLAGGVLSHLWPGVPTPLQGPVIVYVLCLTAMGAQAAVVGWRAQAEPEAVRGRWLALGGLLFVLSDAVLATNKFAGPVPQATLYVLSLYWAGQTCIVAWLSPKGVKTS
ncbi:lysoplasmalogenase [Roseateles koreensis]|uniref:Lysoplasmalogenase n=1 Tax=Roseateles koreensis TaxID=2987526 RepID=A0ABT5KPZ3_9BURK|nr:lysoplasmalogenase [Roseateles koreensis]MDC8784978.1 lysoplasmalogenase [Roseateles koreensis]